MKLLSDRILVKALPREDNTTEAGIILNNEAKNKNDFEVVLIGKKTQYIKVGDKIRKFKNAIGNVIKYDGVDHLLLRESSDIEFIL